MFLCVFLCTVLDASATAQPGFVWGNNYWLGSRKQCESIQYRKHITLSPRFERNMKANLVDARAPFDVGYRIVHAQHASPWQVEVEFLISAVRQRMKLYAKFGYVHVDNHVVFFVCCMLSKHRKFSISVCACRLPAIIATFICSPKRIWTAA